MKYFLSFPFFHGSVFSKMLLVDVMRSDDKVVEMRGDYDIEVNRMVIILAMNCCNIMLSLHFYGNFSYEISFRYIFLQM